MVRFIQCFIARSINFHLLIAFSIRILLLFWSYYQDSNFTVKFTDVDYHVFKKRVRKHTQNRTQILNSTSVARHRTEGVCVEIHNVLRIWLESLNTDKTILEREDLKRPKLYVCGCFARFDYG